MPLLVAGSEGDIVNTSSIDGFWAITNTVYSTTKFSVKGFSEALVNELRTNAPHLKVAVVMPGHIGSSLVINIDKVLGRPTPKGMSAADIAKIRRRMVERGMPDGNDSDEQSHAAIQQQLDDFSNKAHLSAGQAALIILDGVRNDRWRILVGDDAHAADKMVREAPEQVYEADFRAALRKQFT
tara:strand:+ start:117 stop:665 length:549 start_codon:yes stop_codon:yes gene_type:complete